jgi:hypothetical protein
VAATKLAWWRSEVAAKAFAGQAHAPGMQALMPLPPFGIEPTTCWR